MPTPRVFADLHAQARRLARRPEEADDLLQSALLAALESGRTDLASPETRRWLSGVIRNRAAFDSAPSPKCSTNSLLPRYPRVAAISRVCVNAPAVTSIFAPTPNRLLRVPRNSTNSR